MLLAVYTLFVASTKNQKLRIFYVFFLFALIRQSTALSFKFKQTEKNKADILGLSSTVVYAAYSVKLKNRRVIHIFIYIYHITIKDVNFEYWTNIGQYDSISFSQIDQTFCWKHNIIQLHYRLFAFFLGNVLFFPCYNNTYVSNIIRKENGYKHFTCIRKCRRGSVEKSLAYLHSCRFM